MPRPSRQRALRALRALYVIVREPHRDEITEAVALFGARLRAALAARDDRAAVVVLDEIAEWLLRMRHVVTTRLESNFAARTPTLPIGRDSVRHMSFKSRRNRDRSDPFEQLLNSHARLRERLQVLVDAAAELSANGASDDALLEVVEVSHFIDRAATRHELDEEESLFPRLKKTELSPIIARLAREHREHERMHDELRTLAGTCNERPLNDREARQLKALAAALETAYEHHIELEESDLFPAARELLPPDQKAAIAAEMQARRGR